jgi:aubergine
VPQIHEAFARFKIKPLLSVIVVQKRIHTRIFFTQPNGQIGNPPPGTVVDTQCVSADSYDFYLVSQHVNQGTVTPTHYRIVHNEITALSPDHYQQLTYKLCHLYYNWAGK